MHLEYLLNFLERDSPADSYITANIPVEEFTIELTSFPEKSIKALDGYPFIRDIIWEEARDGFYFGVTLFIATDGLYVERLT